MYVLFGLPGQTMKTLRSILFATDLSKESEHAIPWVRWFRCQYRADVCVLHVLDSLQVGGHEFAKQKEQADQQLRRFIRTHHMDRKGIKPVLLAGDVVVSIEKFVTSNGIDLVVLGSRSTGLNRLFLGSISEEIFRSMNCPVLTVGPGVTSQGTTAALKRILFATDLDKRATAGLTAVQTFIGENPSARLTIAHFVQREPKALVERHETRKKLCAEIIKLVPVALRNRITDIVIEPSSPAEGIIQFAKEQKVDLILLCVRSGGSYLRAATHGRPSITHRVIRSAACPVLTIRG
jgi:nucleotide-binding universal stress UspA family protein